MKVLLFGASGMVGQGVLRECLLAPDVTEIVSVVRQASLSREPKVREIARSGDGMYDLTPIREELRDVDACFFCLGVSSLGMSEPEYTRLTYDLTLAAARTMVAANQRITFCYVSGVGTDSTERGRTMWARVKGKTENALLALPFSGAYMFRPGYIQPIGGVKSKTGWVQAAYTVLAPMYPILRPLLRGTTTANFGRALIQVAANGYAKRILYSSDINALAEAP